MTPSKLKVIDSHVHLYTREQLPTLSWTAALAEGHCLKSEHSVRQYSAAASEASLHGFVFIEADRKYDDQLTDWKYPLQEVSYFARIANGLPEPGEDFGDADKAYALAMVPWAPMCSGPQVMDRYRVAVQAACLNQPTFSLVKGFRYLLQSQPAGVMLKPDFVQSMCWLHEHAYTFDVTIDCHSTGTWQIFEVAKLLETLHERNMMPTVVIDHCCKPNPCARAEDKTKALEFQEWSEGIKSLAKFPKTFMKLSGLLSEIPPDWMENETPEELSSIIEPWLTVLNQTYGPDRIMFGSDWPVCTVNPPGERSWQYWYECVDATLERWNYNDEEKANVWYRNATRAYRL